MSGRAAGAGMRLLCSGPIACVEVSPCPAPSLPVPPSSPSPDSQRSINKTLLTGTRHLGSAHSPEPQCGVNSQYFGKKKKNPQTAPGVTWDMDSDAQVCPGVSTAIAGFAQPSPSMSRCAQVSLQPCPGVHSHVQVCPGVHRCGCSHIQACTAMSRYVQVCTAVAAAVSRCAQPCPGVPRSSQVCLHPRPSVHSHSQLCPGVSRRLPRGVHMHTAAPRCGRPKPCSQSRSSLGASPSPQGALGGSWLPQILRAHRPLTSVAARGGKGGSEGVSLNSLLPQNPPRTRGSPTPTAQSRLFPGVSKSLFHSPGGPRAPPHPEGPRALSGRWRS